MHVWGKENRVIEEKKVAKDMEIIIYENRNIEELLKGSQVLN